MEKKWNIHLLLLDNIDLTLLLHDAEELRISHKVDPITTQLKDDFYISSIIYVTSAVEFRRITNTKLT